MRTFNKLCVAVILAGMFHNVEAQNVTNGEAQETINVNSSIGHVNRYNPGLMERTLNTLLLILGTGLLDDRLPYLSIPLTTVWEKACHRKQSEQEQTKVNKIGVIPAREFTSESSPNRIPVVKLEFNTKDFKKVANFADLCDLLNEPENFPETVRKSFKQLKSNPKTLTAGVWQIVNDDPTDSINPPISIMRGKPGNISDTEYDVQWSIGNNRINWNYVDEIEPDPDATWWKFEPDVASAQAGTGTYYIAGPANPDSIAQEWTVEGMDSNENRTFRWQGFTATGRNPLTHGYSMWYLPPQEQPLLDPNWHLVFATKIPELTGEFPKFPISRAVLK